MKLFLASEAKHPESMKKLEKFVGGFSGKSIAYIPTAANGEGYGSWKEGGSWALVNTLGTNTTLVELENYRDSKVVNVLKGKDIIWIAGGYCGYLMYWLRRCELDKSLPNLLNSGSIYVSSSAGSMVAAPTIEIAEWYLGEGEPGTKGVKGLGLVDFDFYPHYEESMLPEIKKHYTGNKMYLVKNGDAITVVDGKVEVLGEERIITG